MRYYVLYVCHQFTIYIFRVHFVSISIRFHNNEKWTQSGKYFKSRTSRNRAGSFHFFLFMIYSADTGVICFFTVHVINVECLATLFEQESLKTQQKFKLIIKYVNRKRMNKWFMRWIVILSAWYWGAVHIIIIFIIIQNCILFHHSQEQYLFVSIVLFLIFFLLNSFYECVHVHYSILISIWNKDNSF